MPGILIVVDGKSNCRHTVRLSSGFRSAAIMATKSSSGMMVGFFRTSLMKSDLKSGTSATNPLLLAHRSAARMCLRSRLTVAGARPFFKTLLADPPWLCVHCFLMPLCKSPRIDQPIGEFFAGKNRAARNGKTWLQNSPENQGNSNLGRSRH
jgi:hypothetical protein